MSVSILNFAKPDSGWGEGDNKKARAMILRKRLDGSPRFTDEQIAGYMGMSPAYVAKLRRGMQGRRDRRRYG